jgi:hypothetical protein
MGTQWPTLGCLVVDTEQLAFDPSNYRSGLALTQLANNRCSSFYPANDKLQLSPDFPNYWHTVDIA